VLALDFLFHSGQESLQAQEREGQKRQTQGKQQISDAAALPPAKNAPAWSSGE
jgi:hypothetical protein